MSNETKISDAADLENPEEITEELESQSTTNMNTSKRSIIDQNPPEPVMDEEENLATVNTDEDPESVATDDEVLNNVADDDDDKRKPFDTREPPETVPDSLPDDTQTTKAANPPFDGNVTSGSLIDPVDDMDNLVIHSDQATNAISDDERLDTKSYFEQTLQDSRTVNRSSTLLSKIEKVDKYPTDEAIPENIPVMDDILSDVAPEEPNVHMDNEDPIEEILPQNEKNDDVEEENFFTDANDSDETLDEETATHPSAANEEKPAAPVDTENLNSTSQSDNAENQDVDNEKVIDTNEANQEEPVHSEHPEVSMTDMNQTEPPIVDDEAVINSTHNDDDTGARLPDDEEEAQEKSMDNQNPEALPDDEDEKSIQNENDEENLVTDNAPPVTTEDLEPPMADEEQPDVNPTDKLPDNQPAEIPPPAPAVEDATPSVTRENSEIQMADDEQSEANPTDKNIDERLLGNEEKEGDNIVDDDNTRGALSGDEDAKSTNNENDERSLSVTRENTEATMADDDGLKEFLAPDDKANDAARPNDQQPEMNTIDNDPDTELPADEENIENELINNDQSGEALSDGEDAKSTNNENDERSPSVTRENTEATMADDDGLKEFLAPDDKANDAVMPNDQQPADDDKSGDAFSDSDDAHIVDNKSDDDNFVPDNEPTEDAPADDSEVIRSISVTRENTAATMADDEQPRDFMPPDEEETKPVDNIAPLVTNATTGLPTVDHEINGTNMDNDEQTEVNSIDNDTDIRLPDRENENETLSAVRPAGKPHSPSIFENLTPPVTMGKSNLLTTDDERTREFMSPEDRPTTAAAEDEVPESSQRGREPTREFMSPENTTKAAVINDEIPESSQPGREPTREFMSPENTPRTAVIKDQVPKSTEQDEKQLNTTPMNTNTQASLPESGAKVAGRNRSPDKFSVANEELPDMLPPSALVVGAFSRRRP